MYFTLLSLLFIVNYLLLVANCSLLFTLYDQLPSAVHWLYSAELSSQLWLLEIQHKINIQSF